MSIGYKYCYMKKPILLFSLLSLMVWSFGIHANAQEATTDRLVLSDLTSMGSPNLYYFDISLVGSRIYTAYNMDIILPEGIDIAMSGSNYLVSMVKPSLYPYTEDFFTSEKTYTHTVSVSMPNEHQLRIACSSSTNAEFTAISGTLFRVAVILDDSKFTFSPKPIVKVTGINLTQKEGAKKYVPADFSCRPFSTGIPAERTLPINISDANKVGTLILPFDAALPAGVQAYRYDAVDQVEKTLNLVVTNSFEACTPYIVYAENGYSGNISGIVDLDASYPDEDVFTDEGLTGVLTTTVVNTGYIMQNQGDGPMFYSAVGQNFTLPAGRCYMTTPSSKIKAFMIHFDDESNGVVAVKEDLSSNTWYTLQGVKLDNRPTEKGIYLKGNKKILIH